MSVLRLTSIYKNWRFLYCYPERRGVQSRPAVRRLPTCETHSLPERPEGPPSGLFFAHCRSRTTGSELAHLRGIGHARDADIGVSLVDVPALRPRSRSGERRSAR